VTTNVTANPVTFLHETNNDCRPELPLYVNKFPLQSEWKIPTQPET